jgi:peroxiredoxin
MTKSLPETKLDPVLPDINGKKVALSSLKGKYVLLTFWSAKNNDCVQENLQFKELYKLYNKKGFEIYQINLDESEADWKAAVRFDELPWISTREEDLSNPKNAILFNVKSLPSNYLFDKSGKLIAVNLHGRTLALKLEQLFNR